MRQTLTNNLDSQLGPIVRSSRDVLDLAQSEHPIYDFTEHYMFLIEEVALSCCYEELQNPIGMKKSTYRRRTDLTTIGVRT